MFSEHFDQNERYCLKNSCIGSELYIYKEREMNGKTTQSITFFSSYVEIFFPRDDSFYRIPYIYEKNINNAMEGPFRQTEKLHSKI